MQYIEAACKGKEATIEATKAHTVDDLLLSEAKKINNDNGQLCHYFNGGIALLYHEIHWLNKETYLP